MSDNINTINELEALAKEGRELHDAMLAYCRKMAQVRAPSEEAVDDVPTFLARSYAAEAAHHLERIAGRIWAVTGDGRPAPWLCTLDDYEGKVNA